MSEMCTATNIRHYANISKAICIISIYPPQNISITPYKPPFSLIFSFYCVILQIIYNFADNYLSTPFNESLF